MGILLATEASEVLVAQLCMTVFDPMGCSLLGSSVHGILQDLLNISTKEDIMESLSGRIH